METEASVHDILEHMVHNMKNGVDNKPSTCDRAMLPCILQDAFAGLKKLAVIGGICRSNARDTTSMNVLEFVQRFNGVDVKPSASPVGKKIRLKEMKKEIQKIKDQIRKKFVLDSQKR